MKKHFQIIFKTIIILSVIIMPEMLLAQKWRGLTENWYANAHVGRSLFHGDITNLDYDPVNIFSSDNKWAYGLTFGKQFNGVFGFQAQLLRGQLAGKLSQIKGDLTSYQYFKTNFFEYNVQATINFVNILLGDKNKSKVLAYGIIGFGMVSFRSIRYDAQSDTIISTCGYGANNVDKINRGNGFAIPIGGGLGYKINDNWEVYAENVLRRTFTDKLDAYEGNSDKDRYSYTSLGVKYTFDIEQNKGGRGGRNSYFKARTNTISHKYKKLLEKRRAEIYRGMRKWEANPSLKRRSDNMKQARKLRKHKYKLHKKGFLKIFQ